MGSDKNSSWNHQSMGFIPVSRQSVASAKHPSSHHHCNLVCRPLHMCLDSLVRVARLVKENHLISKTISPESPEASKQFCRRAALRNTASIPSRVCEKLTHSHARLVKARSSRSQGLGSIRFLFSDVNHFQLSFQSPFHLSLMVLNCYRSRV